MNAYRSIQWRRFRAEVIELDLGECQRCGRSAADGAVLQVHHLQYLPGRKPWDYPRELCETLCKGCHAAEHGHIPPTLGWTFVGCDDLGDLSGACDCCGTSIRHVFMVVHEAWGTLEVGTDCCDRLTSTTEASDYRAELAKVNAKRKRFVSSPYWRIDHNAHWRYFRTLPGRWRVEAVVKPEPGGYRLNVNGQSGSHVHETILAAKVALFEAINGGQLQRWLRRRQERAIGGPWRPHQGR